ncbi:hypothetical protein LLEC1_04069 [Akanthomyces lecanii]|uniref:non-specific serine/threonine protein kinase n=1 Tax=Cordyceps confragosa TaxID=2714763 RepID=A0A179II22_CORDF|nr:hypothetical protein LLEC1_04069 [Akanthomyces lecanii]
MFEYKLIDGAERLEKYGPGGYHPILVGDRIRDRYEVVDKLGYGGWSTVWLVRDCHEKKYVALKVGIADSLPREIPILKALNTQAQDPGAENVPRLLDVFTIDGPNGSHPCYTTVLALGNLRECSFSRLFRLDVARILVYELTLAVAFVHSQGFVHGDIHLRNVLMPAQDSLNQMSIAEFRKAYGEPDSWPVERLDKQPLTPNVPSTATIPLYLGKTAQKCTIKDARVLLSDFGESYAPAKEVRLGKDCHTPVDFRPPEAVLEPDTILSFPADVWSLATAIWDIVGMQALFSSAFYSDEEVMCQIVDCFGPPPVEWYENWTNRGDFYDDTGAPKEGRHVWPNIEAAFEERVKEFRRGADKGEFCNEEEEAFLDMIKQMLRYKPEERPTVQQVLQSHWMVNWAQRDYKRSQVLDVES